MRKIYISAISLLASIPEYGAETLDTVKEESITNDVKQEVTTEKQNNVKPEEKSVEDNLTLKSEDIVGSFELLSDIFDYQKLVTKPYKLEGNGGYALFFKVTPELVKLVEDGNCDELTKYIYRKDATSDKRKYFDPLIAKACDDLVKKDSSGLNIKLVGLKALETLSSTPGEIIKNRNLNLVSQGIQGLDELELKQINNAAALVLKYNKESNRFIFIVHNDPKMNNIGEANVANNYYDKVEKLIKDIEAKLSPEQKKEYETLQQKESELKEIEKQLNELLNKPEVKALQKENQDKIASLTQQKTQQEKAKAQAEVSKKKATDNINKQVAAKEQQKKKAPKSLITKLNKDIKNIRSSLSKTIAPFEKTIRDVKINIVNINKQIQVLNSKLPAEIEQLQAKEEEKKKEVQGIQNSDSMKQLNEKCKSEIEQAKTQLQIAIEAHQNALKAK